MKRHKRRRTTTPAPSHVERCERRVLLSAISGQVFNDLNSNGVKDPGEGTLPGWTLYVDQNNNGIYDANVSTANISSTDVPKTIPETAPITSSAAVSGVIGSITHLTVTVSINHSFDPDLQMDLISPSGTSVRLIDSVKDSGQNFSGTTLDDQATTPIESGAAPFIGTYRPSNPLALFNGQDPNGTWQLRLANDAIGDTGTLNSWSLHFTLGEPLARTDLGGNYVFRGLPAGSYTVRELPEPGWSSTLPANGAAAVTVDGTTDVSGVNFGNKQTPAVISGTKFNDLNGNGVRDPGEPALAGWTIFLDTNGNGRLDPGEPSTVTDSNGNWSLPVPAQGSYIAREVPQSGWGQTLPGPGPVAAGPNVNISREPGTQTEGAIAIDRTNPNRLFVASNEAAGTPALLGAYSTDAGITWHTRPLATGSDGLPAACCDPSVSFDAFGNLFLAYENASGTAVEVARSADAGQTFTLIGSFAGASDQPTVTTGPGGAYAPGSVWVTWGLRGNMVAIGAPVSALGAVGAFGPVESLPGTAGSFGDISIGPTGQVIEAWQADNTNNAQGPDTIYESIDSDGLGPQAFGPAVMVTTTNVGTVHTIPAQATRTIDAEVGVVWDRSGGAHNGRAYLVYTDESPADSDNTDILLRHSDDNGVTWSAPLRVNDDATSRSQFLPRIAVDQATGNVAVSWYDCRNDSGIAGFGSTNAIANDDAQLYTAVSTDGGATFGTNVRVSAGASNSADSHNLYDFGDYGGLDFYAGRLYPVWADNSNSTADNPDGALHGLDIYTARVNVQSSDGGQYGVVAGPGAGVSGLDFGNTRPTVVARYVFYNHSAFDGNDPGANAADDTSIDYSKQALRPGAGAASFSNVTSYSRGINGIMIDVAGLAGPLVPNDFAFSVGNTADPTHWAPAPAPLIVTRPAPNLSGVTRIEIIWPDHAIRNQWLQITLKPTADTGLASADVFYFGNLIGLSDKGPVTGQFVITSADEAAAKSDPHGLFNPALISNGHDYSRDGRVDAIDQLIARHNLGATLLVLQPIVAPIPTPGVPLARPGASEHRVRSRHLWNGGIIGHRHHPVAAMVISVAS